MKAILNETFGLPEVLHLKDVPKPVPKKGEALIKVHAVSLNDWDWAYITGKPYIYRLLFGFFKPRVTILGSDVAGIVEEVGEGATQFKPGDTVYGDLSERWGGFAEYVCAVQNDLEKIPEGMSFNEAASIPQAGMLAVQGLIDKGEIKSGQEILINGAGGGVGMFGVQIAKHFGCRVTGVDNTGKQEFMRTLGFDHVIDYTKENFTQLGKQYDLILDNKTGHSLFQLNRAMKPGGKYVTTGGSLPKLLQVALGSPLFKLFFKKSALVVALKKNKDLNYIAQLYQSGKLKPVLDTLYTLAETPKAFERFARGEHRGKVVVVAHED